MSNQIIFYFVFLAQLAFISVYLPNVIVQRMKYVVRNFPPEQYPKLYSGKNNFFANGYKGYIIANYVIVVASLCILFYCHINQVEVVDIFPVLVFFAQSIPSIYLELAEKKYFQSIRHLNLQTTRKSNLSPRKLSDFVSIKLVGFTLAFALLAIIIDIYLSQDKDVLIIGLSEDTLIKSTMIILLNIGLFVYFNYVIYSKKIDQFQDDNDRFNVLATTIKSMLYMSILVSAFFILVDVTDGLSVPYLEIIMISVYCLALAIFTQGYKLKTLDINKMNFEVYRA